MPLHFAKTEDVAVMLTAHTDPVSRELTVWYTLHPLLLFCYHYFSLSTTHHLKGGRHFAKTKDIAVMLRPRLAFGTPFRYYYFLCSLDELTYQCDYSFLGSYCCSLQGHDGVRTWR